MIKATYYQQSRTVQFGDLLGTAFLLLAFLALTAVGDPFVISLGGQDPAAVLAP